eukprot:4920449-Karenia_brevis.AAC.1
MMRCIVVQKVLILWTRSPAKVKRQPRIRPWPVLEAQGQKPAHLKGSQPVVGLCAKHLVAMDNIEF